MEIVKYFSAKNKEHWLEQIGLSDWSAGKYLYELLQANKLKALCGESTEVFLLTDGERLLSFCTFAEKDDIADSALTPWIGFVYTFPQARGNRFMGKLFEHIRSLAKTQGIQKIYISTNEIGLYEKYSCVFYKMMKDIHNEDSRVYCLNVE